MGFAFLINSWLTSPVYEDTPRRVVHEEKIRLGWKTRNLYSADNRKPALSGKRHNVLLEAQIRVGGP